MELVHDDLADVGRRPVAQGDVGQHLGGAADDRSSGVDRGVAGHHADIGGPEGGAQVEELLRHQRLHRGGVETARRTPILGDWGSSRREGDEMSARRHQALPRPGRGAHDHVGARHHLDQRLLLRRVHRQPPTLHPHGEGVEQAVRVAGGREELGEGHDCAHAARSAARRRTSLPLPVPGPGLRTPR